ncbi:MAG: type II secretion system F family protein [Candidatus Anstonellales archaeon]
MSVSLFDLAEKFPALNVKAESVKKALRGLGYEIDEGRFVSLAIATGLLFFVLGILLGGIVFGVIFFAFGYAYVIYYPQMKLAKKVADIEAEMPLSLRTLGMLINMNVPFVKALKVIAESKTPFGNELENAVKEIERGSSVPKALGNIAERINSIAVKRAIAQVISAYEQGAGGNEIKRIANELLSIQRHRIKEFSSKSAMYGLFFIVMAAVAPTFFLVMSVVGRFAFQMNMSGEMVYIMYLIVFPLLSLLILLLSKSSLPPSLFKERRELKAYLPLAGATVIVVGVWLLPVDMIFKIPILGIILLFSAKNFYSSYKEGKEVESIESNLPDALFSIAGMPKGAHIEKIFERIARAGFGRLSMEFETASKQMKANVKPEIVVRDLGERVGSDMLTRAGEIMVKVFEAGGHIGERLAELAEDMLLFYEMKRERANVLSMQKYTLLAGAVIIPLILSTALGLVGKIAGLMEEQSDIIDVAHSVIPLYLIIYSCLTAFYISDSEGKPSKGLVYFVGIALVSIGIFYFAGSSGVG